MLAVLALSILTRTATAAPPPADDSLWVSDDVNVTIYNVAMDGTMLSSFHSGSISGLALSVDPVDGTLWAAKEGSSTIEHYTKDGTKLSVFSTLLYDPLAKRPEGIAVDFIDGTLWIVDDFTNTVYNVERDGTYISSFPVSSFDPAVLSPQCIAYDPLTDTLWLTDNGTESIYNVTREGWLVSAFSALGFSAEATNLQGIGVDMVDGTLWVTDRHAKQVFHVTRDGVLLSSFPSASFGSNNPTGVSYDRADVVTYAALVAEIDAGLAGGLISQDFVKHLNQFYKQLDKQLEKGHLRAAASIVYGFKDLIVGKIASGEIDASYGVELAFDAISMSGGMEAGAREAEAGAG